MLKENMIFGKLILEHLGITFHSDLVYKRQW